MTWRDSWWNPWSRPDPPRGPNGQLMTGGRGKDAGPPERGCYQVDNAQPRTFTTCEPDYCTHDPEPLPAEVPARYAGACLHCLTKGIRSPDGTRAYVVFDGRAADREAGQ